MKKIILIAIVVLIASIAVVNAQTKSHAYGLEIGYWNKYSEKWDFKEMKTIDLTFTVAKTYVSCNDVANSIYIIKRDLGATNTKQYNAYRWGCSDEKGRNCWFSMTLYLESGTQTYTVTYDDICFRYYISSKSGLDKFD